MEHDYIIVGSGVAGATVANELLKDNPKLKILMLEAGAVSTLKDRRLWWNYVRTGIHPYASAAEDKDETSVTGVSIGKATMELKGSRLMTYGGSTVHWGGWSLRLKPEDFQMKTNIGRGIDWPITYNDLEPYYIKAESYLSVSGPHKRGSEHAHLKPAFPYAPSDEVMIRGLEKLQWSYESMPVARYRKCMKTGTCKYCPIGARFTAAYVLDDINETMDYPNFTIRCNTPVRKLTIDKNGNIIGITAFDTEKRVEFSATAKKIILACGTIETPKLMLASTEKNIHKNGVGNDNDQVGRNFVAHPMLIARGSLNKKAKKKTINPDKLLQEYDFATLMSRKFDSKKYQHLGKLFLFKSRSRPRIFLGQEMKEGHSLDEINKKIENEAEFEIQAFMEEFPRRSNFVSLKKGEFDRFGLPLTQINYDHEKDFMMRMNRWLDKMNELLIAMDVTPTKKFLRTPRADHAGGTCRMSAQPIDGVVDKNLKVWGIDNLYIISNAVFPNIGAVNPTLTLTALAFRLANHLKSSLS